MNRKWIPLVVAIAAGLTAYCVARNSVCGRPGTTRDRLHDMSFLTRELGLSDAQAMEIGRLNTTLGSELDGSCVLHCAARARLGQALAADGDGSSKVDIVLEEMCRAYEQSERATLNHIRAVRTVLNAEQRRRFDKMVSDCMCRPCSGHGASCMADAEGRAIVEPQEN